MNKKYAVEYEQDNHGSSWLKVTHNGYQWQTIRIDNPEYEIPLIISELERHLSSSIHSDREHPAVNKGKSSDDFWREYKAHRRAHPGR